MRSLIRLFFACLVLLSLTSVPVRAQDDPQPPDAADTDTLSPDVGATPTTVVASPTPISSPVAAPATPSFDDVVAAAQPSVVRVATDAVVGSGVRVADGILTSAHVVRDTNKIDVYTFDHRHAVATVVRIDIGADIALLKADVAVPPLDLEPVGGQHAGDPVAAIGYPGQDVDPGASSVSRGLLNSTGTGVQGRSLLELSTNLEPGYSGGPILNARGHVVGLSTYVVSVEGSVQLNFALGSDTAYAFLALPDAQVAPRPIKLFTGDARSASLPQAYLGTGWVLDSEDTTKVNQGQYQARYHLDARDGGGRIVVSVGTDVTTSPAAAAIELPQAVKSIDQQLNWLGTPQIGDEAGAWLSQSGQSAVVAARIDNVIVYAAESRSTPLAVDNVIGVSDMVQYMCNRVVSQVSQAP